jgi:hypothetical protein
VRIFIFILFLTFPQCSSIALEHCAGWRAVRRVTLSSFSSFAETGIGHPVESSMLSGVLYALGAGMV